MRCVFGWECVTVSECLCVSECVCVSLSVCEVWSEVDPESRPPNDQRPRKHTNTHTRKHTNTHTYTHTFSRLTHTHTHTHKGVIRTFPDSQEIWNIIYKPPTQTHNQTRRTSIPSRTHTLFFIISYLDFAMKTCIEKKTFNNRKEVSWPEPYVSYGQRLI